VISRGWRWLQQALRADVLLLASVGVICACLWLFIEVAEEVGEGDHLPVEERIILSLREPGDPTRLIGPKWLAEAARDVSALGGTTVLTLVTTLTLAYLLLLGRRHAALFVSLTVGGGYVLSTLLKSAFGRARPDELLHLMRVNSASFPSGHSMLSSVVYVTLGALLAHRAFGRGPKLFVLSAALGLSFLVGLSRIFLGVHYPSDVVSGWTAGIAWSLLCSTIASRLQRTEKLKQTESAP